MKDGGMEIKMKILCMEDQEDKYQHINSVLRQHGITQIFWEKNCQTGLMRLLKKDIDYLLLDMSMPLSDVDYKKESFDSFAGLAVLQEIKRKKYTIKVIIVTGFNDFERGKKIITLDELESEIKQKYKDCYVGYIKYDSTSIEWQQKLIQILSGGD